MKSNDGEFSERQSRETNTKVTNDERRWHEISEGDGRFQSVTCSDVMFTGGDKISYRLTV